MKAPEKFVNTWGGLGLSFLQSYVFCLKLLSCQVAFFKTSTCFFDANMPPPQKKKRTTKTRTPPTLPKTNIVLEHLPSQQEMIIFQPPFFRVFPPPPLFLCGYPGNTKRITGTLLDDPKDLKMSIQSEKSRILTDRVKRPFWIVGPRRFLLEIHLVQGVL